LQIIHLSNHPPTHIHPHHPHPQERPDLSSLKGQLALSNAKMRADLAALEGRILELLSAAAGDILDDEELIGTLAQAKVTSNEVAARMAEAEATERDIDAARDAYRPVPRRAALLFFTISELAGVDPMYQYSLGWFRALFVRGMDETAKVGWSGRGWGWVGWGRRRLCVVDCGRRMTQDDDRLFWIVLCYSTHRRRALRRAVRP